MKAQQAAAPSQTKRPLMHQDYDAWRSINGATLSRDGEWLGYAALPQDGDGELIIKNLATGAEWRTPRGWCMPTPPPDLSDPAVAVAAIAAPGRLSRPFFTADARFALFTIEPLKADVLKAHRVLPGLRRLNKEVYFFNYNGEPHGIRRRPNQKDYTRRLQEFFDHKLKGAPLPEWMDKGIRYVDREKEKEKYKTASDVATTNKQ